MSAIIFLMSTASVVVFIIPPVIVVIILLSLARDSSILSFQKNKQLFVDLIYLFWFVDCTHGLIYCVYIYIFLSQSGFLGIVAVDVM